MPPRRILRNDADRAMDTFIRAIRIQTFSRHQRQAFPRLSPGNLAYWIGELRDREAQLRQIRAQLEALQTGDGRKCPACGRPVAGRPDKVYCSAACRIRAHRSSLLVTPEAVTASYVVRPGPWYGDKVAFQVNRDPHGWDSLTYGQAKKCIEPPCSALAVWRVERLGKNLKRTGHIGYYCDDHLGPGYAPEPVTADSEAPGQP